MNMEFFRIWVLPPLAGAIIGYFTNWLAIKMLFRPYREIRLAGIKLPFTPGILPRERARLAQSLGDTVAKELLTPEVISSRFRSPQVQGTASTAAETALRGFLEMDAACLFPGDLEDGNAPQGVVGQNGQVLDSVRFLASSPEFQSAVRSLIDELAARIGDLKLREILSSDQFVSVLRRAVLAISESAGSMRHTLALLVHLPPDAVVRVLSDHIVPPAYRVALPALKAFLRGQEFRRRLELEGLALVRRALERLGPVQRLFVSLAGYEVKIAQSMPETIEDLIDTIEALLEDPDIPGKLAQALCGVVIEQRAVLLSRVDLKPETTGSSDRRPIYKEIAEAFDDSNEEFSRRAAEIYDRIAEYRLSELIESGFEPGLLSSAVISAATRVIQESPRAKSSQGSRSLGTLIREVLRDAAHGKTIARFLGINDESLSRIAATLSSRLLDVVAGRMPDIVEALDIRSMVAERIDSLDMAEVERLVLQVAQKELAWITWLGGLLGAIIGLVQSLVSLI